MLTATDGKRPLHQRNLAKALGAMGIGGDDMVAHINEREAAMLRAMGGSGTINPRTGLRQFAPVDHSAAGNGGDGSGGLGSGPNNGSGGSPVDRNPADNGGLGGGGLGLGVGGPGNQNGSGLGPNGGNSGNSFAANGLQGGGAPQVIFVPSSTPAPAPAPAPPPPPTLAPLMSQTPTTDLTGGKYGPVPSWATTPYQIGMAPTSFPVPGQIGGNYNPGGGGGSGIAGFPGGTSSGGFNGGGGALPGSGGADQNLIAGFQALGSGASHQPIGTNAIADLAAARQASQLMRQGVSLQAIQAYYSPQAVAARQAMGTGNGGFGFMG